MLIGDRITLRELNKSDIDFLISIENNDVNWEFGSEYKFYTRKQLLNYISNARIDISIAKQFRFVIDLDNNPIGFIDLYNYKVSEISIGIIIDSNYRNMGYGKDSLNVLINYAFNILQVNKICACVKKSNLNSINLFISCGFVLSSYEKDLQYFIKLAKIKS
tara:strand:+ start:7684 stop:8169 length:486 start_codon:yes stop_codon:yes gene_type:complete